MSSSRALTGSLIILALSCARSAEPPEGGAGGRTGSGGTGGIRGPGPECFSRCCYPASCPTPQVAWYNGYGVSDVWHGYAFTQLAGPATSTISPECNDLGTALCFQTAGSKLCASGNVGVDPSSTSAAIIAWNINQAELPPYPPELIATQGQGLLVDLTVNSSNSHSMRIQIQAADDDNSRWCAPIPTGGVGEIPWNKFNTKCWDNSGSAYVVGTPISQIALIIPNLDGEVASFDLCINGYGVY